MMSKKAQAATEYLSTYGWAVLILALVLAALWVMGVFDIKAPETCRFDIGTFECANYKILGGGPADNYYNALLPFSVKNNFGKRVYVCAVMCSQGAPDPSLGYPVPTAGPNGFFDIDYMNPACGYKPGGPAGGGVLIEPGNTELLASEVNSPHMFRVGSYCYDRSNGYDERATIGSAYNTRIYIAYSFEGETTGAARLAVGELSTTVQRWTIN